MDFFVDLLFSPVVTFNLKKKIIFERQRNRPRKRENSSTLLVHFSNVLIEEIGPG